jgi:hypothetical protein
MRFMLHRLVSLLTKTIPLRDKKCVALAWRISMVLALFAGLNGCSQTADRQNSVSQYFDFSAVKYYAMHARGSILYQQQSIADHLRNVTELSLENRLAKLGLNHSSLTQAQVIFSYHILDGDQHALARYNQFVHLCVQCAVTPHQTATFGIDANDNAARGQPSNRAPQQANRAPMAKQKLLGFIPEGLIIDAVDPKTSRSVWRAQQLLAISAKDNSQEVKQKIEQAITLAFTRYPTHYNK